MIVPGKTAIDEERAAHYGSEDSEAPSEEDEALLAMGRAIGAAVCVSPGGETSTDDESKGKVPEWW